MNIEVNIFQYIHSPLISFSSSRSEWRSYRDVRQTTYCAWVFTSNPHLTSGCYKRHSPPFSRSSTNLTSSGFIAPATQKWTNDYLVSKMGDHKISIAITPNGLVIFLSCAHMKPTGKVSLYHLQTRRCSDSRIGQQIVLYWALYWTDVHAGSLD